MHFVKFKDGNIINLEDIVTVFKQTHNDEDEEDDEYVTYEVLLKYNVNSMLG